MVSPRKRSMVVRQMRSGAKALPESPEDWVSGSKFQFKDSAVVTKRVVETRRSSIFKRPPQRSSPKNRRQSVLLKRLDLAPGTLVVSPASSHRRTRRQSLAVMSSGITIANELVKVKSKTEKATNEETERSLKKTTPKKMTTPKKVMTPESKQSCSLTLSPLVFYSSPDKKAKVSSQNSPLRAPVAKRKVDMDALNKVNSPPKKLKRASSEVSKITKSPILGKRRLRSEIPLKVDTSTKYKAIVKNVSASKLPKTSPVKLKSSYVKGKNQSVVESPKEENLPKQDKIPAKSKQNAGNLKSPVSAKTSASKKITSPVVLAKAAPKKKPVVTPEIKVNTNSTNSGKVKKVVTPKKKSLATPEMKVNTKSTNSGKVKKVETAKSSPKVLTPPKKLVKKAGLTPGNKTSPKQNNSKNSSPIEKLNKSKPVKTPKSVKKESLSSPKSSIQKKSQEDTISPPVKKQKLSSGCKVSPKSLQKSATPSKQGEVILKKNKTLETGKKSVPSKKESLPSKVSTPQNLDKSKPKEVSSSAKRTDSSKKNTTSLETSAKKAVTIKTPTALKRLDSPQGGIIRLTRSSRRVTLVGKSPKGLSFKKTPKTKTKQLENEKDIDIGASPVFSACAQLKLIRSSSPLRIRSRASPAAKVNPFTPKPDSPPSHVLRKTLKKNVAQKMHATTKVEVHQLMNGEISKPVSLINGKKIVTESVTVTQTQVSSLNIAVTPRKALSSDHPDGADNIKVTASTPVSVSNLPPTPTSSHKKSESIRSLVSKSASRVSSHRSLMMSTPRSSTPIGDEESIKLPTVEDNSMDKETNFTDDTIHTDVSDDEDSMVAEIKEDVVPEKPKRSYCSLM